MTDPTDSRGTLDVSLDALSHPYRRRILTRLDRANPRDESSFSTDSVANDDEDETLVAIDVHHRHLPKLAEAGFVDWDRESNAVRRGPRFDEIAPLLELENRYRDELPKEWP